MINNLPYGKGCGNSVYSHPEAVFLGVLENDPKRGTLNVYRIGGEKAVVDERTGEITQITPYFQEERKIDKKEIPFKKTI